MTGTAETPPIRDDVVEPAVPPTVRLRPHDWFISGASAVVALAALIGGSAFGMIHGAAVRPRVIAWGAALLFIVFGILATRRLSRALDHAVTSRTIPVAGAATRLLLSGVGYLIVIFGVFGVLDVSMSHLLVGAGLAGVVLGIAAQQSLGNAFAALVLLFARPFVVGGRIRVRSGALGGIFDATVLGISLTYVTMRTDAGVLKVPNSTLLAAGVGVLTPEDDRPLATLRQIRRERRSTGPPRPHRARSSRSPRNGYETGRNQTTATKNPRQQALGRETADADTEPRTGQPGPIGLSAIMGAKLFSPSHIVSIDLADARLDAAKRFGADVAVNNSSEDAIAIVEELTGGLGADVTIEAVGTPATFELAADLVRAGGHVANTVSMAHRPPSTSSASGRLT